MAKKITVKTILRGTGLDEEGLLKLVSDYYAEAKSAKDDTYKVISKATKENVTSDVTQNMLSVYDKWYNGQQWEVDPDGTYMTDKGEIAKPVVNYTKTIVDQRVDMMKRRKVSFDTTPVGLEDLDKSLFWQALLKFVWKKRQHEGKVALGYQDDLVFGTGFLKAMWNKSVLDAEGDIDLVVLNPMDIFPDKFGLDIPEMRYIHVIYAKPKEYVKDRYNYEAKEDEVLLYETWINPNVLGKDGFCVIWVDERILEVKTLKDVTGINAIPIVAFRTRKSSANFWGTSLVRDISHIQALHNKTIGLIIDNLIITNGGRVCTTDESLIMSNDRREIVTVEDRNDVWSLGLDSLNPAWFNLVQYSAYPLAQTLTGTYAVSAGGAAPTTTSSGIISMQQAGNTGVEADFKDIALSMSYLGKFIVKMIKDLYGNKKIKAILGTIPGMENVDVVSILKKTDENFDIYINFGDSLPEDRLSRNNLLLAMLQAGAISVEMLAKLTENPELMAAIQEKKLATQQQMQQMMASIPPQGTNPTGQPPIVPQSPTSPALSEAQTRVVNTQNKAKGTQSPV